MTKGGVTKIHRDVLVRLWEKGERLDRIAAIFDVTIPAVAAAARRWGLPDRKSPDEVRREGRDERVRQMWADGLPQRQIAKEVGVHETMVRKIADRLCLPPRGAAALPPFDLARARELRAEGRTYGQIGAEFGRSAGWTSARMAEAPAEVVAAAVAPRPAPRAADPHPFWTVERDALVIATAGRYRDLTTLSAALGRPLAYVNQRWLRLRVAG